MTRLKSPALTRLPLPLLEHAMAWDASKASQEVDSLVNPEDPSWLGCVWVTFFGVLCGLLIIMLVA